MDLAEKTEQLRQIRDEVFDLTESPLYEYRTKNDYYAVLGMGHHDADIMFIGEAPGKNEAEQGIPFCGRSGKLLDKLIDSIGLTRDDVYITNIVKDRPPENRDPTKAEITLYAPYLLRQINIIQPAVIATLGRFSMEWILKKFGSPAAGGKISQLRGSVLDADADYGPIKVVPLYHPAVGLYNPGQVDQLYEDFKVLEQFISAEG